MTEQIIQQAAQALRAGKLVAFPTETVYGLGADATNPEAVRQIFVAKKRPYDHPLIVHLANIHQVHDWALKVSEAAMLLADKFWPGPLTLVLAKQPHVLDIVTGGQASIALRIPRHLIAQQLLQAFGGGVAAPSANKFTHISPTTASAVQEELGDKVDMILDGGDCEVGLESTIIDMTSDHPCILRPGMITAESIAEVLGTTISIANHEKHTQRAPGMHHLHYAPTTATTVIPTEAILTLFATLTSETHRIALVTYTPFTMPLPKGIHLISMPRDAKHYAHDLYHTLRTLDHEGYAAIIVEAVPKEAEWEAIRDRLAKASTNKERLIP